MSAARKPREPFAGHDTVQLLAVELSRTNNDSLTVCHALLEVIKDRLWEKKGFATMRELIEAPHSRNGLASTIHRINAHAMTQTWAVAPFYTVATAEGWVEQIVADVKAAQAAVRVAAVKPAMTPSESAKVARRAQTSSVRTSTTTAEDHRRIHVNRLRKGAGDPAHPKHELSKVLLQQVERGEITPRTAKERLDANPRRFLNHAKTITRKLDAGHLAEFLQWLLDQGAVRSINPSFEGFSDGRRPSCE